MAGIFINYRRDDAPGVAGRLADHLAQKFSQHDIFMDVDDMKPGRDFVQQLDQQLSQCNVLLAVIGSNWVNAVDDMGERRLNAQGDYVRIEIASALRRDIPVIPVMVNGIGMPLEQELPEDLKSLARRQALELRHTRFAADCDAIISALREILPKRKSRWILPLGAVGLSAACIAAGVMLWPILRPSPQPAAVVQAPQPAPAITQEAAKAIVSPPPSTSSDTGAVRQRMEAMRQQSELTRQRVSALQPATAPKPALPASSSSARVQTLSVELGDPFDRVKAAYPMAADSGSGDLSMPLDGLRFFFNKDNKTLRTIRADAPFAGTIQGVHIGDAADDVVARLGQPYSVMGTTGYLYNIGGNVIRFDLDGSQKVKSVFAIWEPK